jgi:folate-binding protein YgfZ
MLKDGVQATVRPDRGFLAVIGADARTLLQGLLSQDVEKITPDKAGFGALLTPQGKYLHDMFLTTLDDGLVLECELDRIDDLLKRLKLYRLRAKAEIEKLSGWQCVVLWGKDPFSLGEVPGASKLLDGASAYIDPRLAALGTRIVGPNAIKFAASFEKGTEDTYRAHRISLGVPEGAADIAVDRGFLLESGFDELNGVDWKKGCYVGQELTARTRYRGLVKRRLMSVKLDGEAPAVGEPIQYLGKDAGEMRSHVGKTGLALVRLDAWRAAKDAGEPLTAGDSRLWPIKPQWAVFE